MGRRLRPAPTPGWIEALDQLARATSTGSSLAGAVDEFGARADAPAVLGEIARIRAGGISLPDAIERARRPVPTAPDDRLALSVLSAIAEAGGPPAEPLDRAAGVLRERRGAAAERDVAAAQSRLSAQVLGVLPVGTTAWSATTDPALGHMLFRTPIGLGCLTTGVALDLLGWRWMRRIVRPR
jgi:tight adherence protein B